MGKVALRQGHSVLHFGSPTDAAKYQCELGKCPGENPASRPPTSQQPLGDTYYLASNQECDKFIKRDILGQAETTANKCLDLLVAKIALTGPATPNFGRALRAAPTRQLLQSTLLRDTPLMTILEWIAAASDAGRHLVPIMMTEAVDMVEEVLNNIVNKPAGNYEHEPTIDTSKDNTLSSICDDGEGETDGLLDADRDGAFRDDASLAGMGFWCNDSDLEDPSAATNSHTVLEDAPVQTLTKH